MLILQYRELSAVECYQINALTC